MRLFTLVFATVVCILSAFKFDLCCGRFPGMFRHPRCLQLRSAIITPEKQSIKLHELTASPMRDLATESPRSKFLRAYNILFGAYVLRGVYPVIRKMLVNKNSANPEFRDRNLDRPVESVRDPLVCEEKTLAHPELEHGALLKNHLEVLGGGLMVAAHDVMERLGVVEQANFIEEKWSEKDFSILVQDLEKARQETGAAATCDELSVYDQLLICLHKLNRRFSYFDDSIW